MENRLKELQEKGFVVFEDMTHKEQVLAELEYLYDPNFQVPPGLFIPVGYRLLVKECSQEEHTTEAGIILAANSKLQNAKIGIVYRIGEAVTIPVKIGFKVAYNKHALNGIVHKGVQYTDLGEHDIYSVVPPENYLYPYVPTTEHLRRQELQDFTKRSLDKTDRELDRIQNDSDLKPGI